MNASDTTQLDTMQTAYKAAVDAWIAAIQHEEALASDDHSVIQLDAWEQAGFAEEHLRAQAKDAKKRYENALRQEFYGFQEK